MAEPGIHSVLFNETESAAASLLDRIEIIGRPEENIIIAEVPLDLINREEVPVDEDHVDELVKSMTAQAAAIGGTGQLSPILLGLLPGADKFSIADGFHRDASLHKKHAESVLSTIRVGISEEDLVDLRILTAATHESVAFARIVEWIEDLWGKTPWAQAHPNLRATQAFALAQKNTSGLGLGLSPDESADIKQWVETKSSQWQLAPATIKTHLAVAEAAAPDLVQEARQRKNGHELTAITPLHLKAITFSLGSRYPLQRIAADAAKAHALTVAQTKIVAKSIARAGSEDNARAIIERTDWESLRAKPSGNSKYVSSRPIGKSAVSEQVPTVATVYSPETTRALVYDGTVMARLALQNTVLRGDYAAAPISSKSTPLTIKPLDNLVEVAAPNTPAQTLQAEQRLAIRMERAHEPINRHLMNVMGCTPREIEHVLDDAQTLLRRELREGALRYVEFTDDRQMDLTLIATAKGIIEERRHNTAAVVSLDARKPVSAKTISVEQLGQVLPRLGHTERMALILAAVYRLSPHAIGQVIQRGQRDVARTLATVTDDHIASEQDAATISAPA